MRPEDNGIALQTSKLASVLTQPPIPLVRSEAHRAHIALGLAAMARPDKGAISASDIAGLRLDPDSRLAMLPTVTPDTARSTPAYEKSGTGPTGGWAGQANGTPKNSTQAAGEQRHYWRQGLRNVIDPNLR